MLLRVTLVLCTLVALAATAAVFAIKGLGTGFAFAVILIPLAWVYWILLQWQLEEEAWLRADEPDED